MDAGFIFLLIVSYIIAIAIVCAIMDENVLPRLLERHILSRAILILFAPIVLLLLVIVGFTVFIINTILDRD